VGVCVKGKKLPEKALHRERVYFAIISQAGEASSDVRRSSSNAKGDREGPGLARGKLPVMLGRVV